MFPDMKKPGLDESEAQNENRIPDDTYKKVNRLMVQKMVQGLGAPK